MEAILNWIKGIMGCLIVMSLVLQCVPGKVYRPYLRLFMGIILILVVVSPLTELVGVGAFLETAVSGLAYNEVLPDWEEKLSKGEDWAEEKIIAKAEEMSRAAENGETVSGKAETTEDEKGNVEIKVEVSVEQVKKISSDSENGGEAGEVP